MRNQAAELTAEMAVERGFDLFETLVARGAGLEDVLLEELEPVDDGWIVTIGFNGKRQEISEPAVAGGMAALTGFGQKTTTTVREIRRIQLDRHGRFVKMG